MAIRFIGGAGSIESDIAELVKRARKPCDLHTEYLTLYGDLIESRIKSVRRHRAPGRHGGEMGRWFVEADWPSDGTLPTGRAAAAAFDPFSNARIDGYVVDRLSGAHLPVPPLQWGGVVYPDKEPEPAVEPVEPAASINTVNTVNSPTVNNSAPVNTSPEASVNTPDDDAGEPGEAAGGTDRAEYQRLYQRDLRAARRLGITVAQLREAMQPQDQAQPAPPMIACSVIVPGPVIGAPALRWAA